MSSENGTAASSTNVRLPYNRPALEEAARSSPDWLVEPLISKAGVSVLSGTAGSGKSTLVMCVMMSLATGYDSWHGFSIPHPQHHRILYIDAEQHRSLIARRSLAWVAHHMLPDEWLDIDQVLDKNIVYITDATFSLGNKDEEQVKQAFADMREYVRQRDQRQDSTLTLWYWTPSVRWRMLTMRRRKRR